MEKKKHALKGKVRLPSSKNENLSPRVILLNEDKQRKREGKKSVTTAEPTIKNKEEPRDGNKSKTKPPRRTQKHSTNDLNSGVERTPDQARDNKGWV